MASNSWLPLSAALLLLLIMWAMRCSGLTVDPPEDLAVFDPGHLGRLKISWSPPGRLINMTECSVSYHLEYFDTYKNSWSAVRTAWSTYSAQFDLMKDVRVRVYTMLQGPCTNNAMVMSTNYTELIQTPPSTGVRGTEVQDFICIYQNLEYLECKWKRSPKMPANSQQQLFFWHQELEQAVECPKYIESHKHRSGCNFTGNPVPQFTTINFCINGSSSEGPLKPAFMSLQIQDHVKSAATEKLHLQTRPDKQLQLNWECPAGRIPGHCLEWEVEHLMGTDAKPSRISTLETNLTLSFSDDSARNCFRVRSKLHKYCAEKSFWSDWSPQTCLPEKEEEAAPDVSPVFISVAVAIIAMLFLTLCVGAILRMRKPRHEKKLDSLLTKLFLKNSAVVAMEA
ncbi:interleukin-13 receptor subunit alpha-2 isoform X1 [Mugil cephalus]|uniref:interleukin-13 receptor subunit alpha-2 isoform X1 n=1 Tax=Mugil cephalus TaxID=48193 RepID=UPI001FB818F3|nr:interleukin-13 receptor subunit alpha-2 isoform X1 [Mugil cephalus]XP_047462049.1 interleukin-13 receptor subunit alpha-2 isoform X1 [Mugil cephalus]